VNLDELQRHWNEWGRRDPYFAIISRPDRRGNTWDVDEFFATGVAEIDGLLSWLHELGLVVTPGRALDFGCGVGRLTQALARTFAKCDGVDIAPSMVERANEFNRFGERCRYHVNERDDLAIFADGTFDLIYSGIVLQHIAPEFSTRYVQEFIRVLAPGGVAVFQLPSHPLAPGDEHTQRASIADNAFCAEIVPAVHLLEVEVGSIAKLDALVRNASDEPWPADRFVNLANHWRGADGTLIRNDDGRTSLPATILPGAEVQASLEMRAPEVPGSYLLELDLVIEGVAWFADRGSPTATVSVHVVPRTHSAPADDAIDPVMEMHGVPRDEVEHILSRGGLDVVKVQATDNAVGWYDFWYVAAKPTVSLIERDAPTNTSKRGLGRIRDRFRRPGAST
jgi:SAM-dependent methyltransferase